MVAMEEDEHARRAARGDEVAFAALVSMLAPRVRAFLYRLDPSAADDLAQETFLKAWQRRAAWRGSERGGGSYAGWVLRIAWTVFLDRKRSDERRRAREAEAEPPMSTPRDPELGAALEQALATLDPRERAAAELCFAQGFSHSEAARILAVPLGTAKTLVARARAKLVHLLGEPT